MFTLYQPATARLTSALPEDVAWVTKAGTLKLPIAPLLKAGIDGRCVVLVDSTCCRIALRKAADDETSAALKLRSDKALERRGAVQLNCGGAMKFAGWELGKKCRFHGRKKLTFRQADGLVIIDLKDNPEDQD